MHIALCDDNIADRKQFERLAKRESERRAASGELFFVDSFGSADSLLAVPRQYDAFFLDLCHTKDCDGIALAKTLLDMELCAPIVLCCSDLDYRQQPFPNRVLFLDKPIKASELTACLNHIQEMLLEREPLIEIRNDGKTIYVKEPEILYAMEKGGLLEVTLTENRSFTLMETAKNFFSQLESWPTFFCPTKKVLLNGRYIRTLRWNRVIMKDGSKFTVSCACLPFARAMFKKYTDNGEV